MIDLNELSYREALNNFCTHYCLNDPMKMAVAESAFYACHKAIMHQLVESQPAHGERQPVKAYMAVDGGVISKQQKVDGAWRNESWVNRYTKPLYE